MIISGERRVSYSEIQDRILRVAAGLKSLGLTGGAPVAIMLRNDFALFDEL